MLHRIFTLRNHKNCNFHFKKFNYKDNCMQDSKKKTSKFSFKQHTIFIELKKHIHKNIAYSNIKISIILLIFS